MGKNLERESGCCCCEHTVNSQACSLPVPHLSHLHHPLSVHKVVGEIERKECENKEWSAS